MNRDKLTTVVGAMASIAVGYGIISQAEAGPFIQAVGVIAGVFGTIWAYFTNKE